MFRRVIPICVGIVTVLVLDAQLGNVSHDQFVMIFQSKALRAAAMFGAAYAANGCDAINALMAALIYLYFADKYKKKTKDGACAPPSTVDSDLFKKVA